MGASLLLTDEKNRRARMIPVSAAVAGVAVAVVFILELAGVIHVHFFKAAKWDKLFLAGATLALALGTAWQWRSLVRRGDSIHISSLLKKWRFTVSRTNVFVERQEVYQNNRKRTIYPVGFEDGIERLVMVNARTSEGGQQLAQRLRTALGLGLNDSWMR